MIAACTLAHDVMMMLAGGFITGAGIAALSYGDRRSRERNPFRKDRNR